MIELTKTEIILIFILGMVLGGSLIFSAFYYYFPQEMSSVYKVCRGIETTPTYFDKADNKFTKALEDKKFCITLDRAMAFAIASGSSLTPFYNDENTTLLLVTEFNVNELEVGNLIVYNNTRYIGLYENYNSTGHTIEEIKYINGVPCFIVRGANNIQQDPYCVIKEDIIGVVYGSFAS